MSFRLLGTTTARLLRSSTATATSTSASPSAVSSSSSFSSSSSTTAAAAALAVGSSNSVGCNSNSSVLAGDQARSRGLVGIGIGSIAATLVLLVGAASSSSSLNLLSSSSSSAGEDEEGKDDNEVETKAADILFGKQQHQSFNSDSHNYVFFPRLSLLKNWMHMTSYVDTSTTMCEAPTKSNNINDGNERRDQQQQRNNSNNNNKINTIRNKNRRRMTNVGRFSLVSETARNPSVPVLVLAMTGKPLKSEDFRRLYQQKKVSEKHPRFAARLDSTKTHFVFDNGDDDDRETNDNNEIVYYGGRASVVKKDNVRELLFPAIPIAELKDRINDAALYEPLDLNIRLWEAWTATGGSIGQSGAITSQQKGEGEGKAQDENDVESLLLFRAHHCMADGVSLGALFGDLMDEGPEFQEKIKRQIKIFKQKKKKTPWWKRLLFGLYYWIWGTIQALMYQVYLFSISWYEGWMSPHDDPWVVLQTIYDEKQQQKRSQQQQQQQQQHPPRSLSWATVAPVDEVKKVADFYSRQQQQDNGGSKKKSSRITINDVFCSCVSAAIIKQLKYHRSVNPELASSSSNSTSNSNSKKQLSLPYMNLIMPVHLQGGILLPGQSMGNKIGAMVSRIPGENLGHDDDVNDNEHNDPAILAQERLIQVHRVLNERKQTPAAVLSYLAAGIMGRISPSSASSASASASGNNNVDDDTSSSSTYSVGSTSSSWTPWLFRKAHANASVVVTNVRGPESCVHLEGRSIRAFLGFLPLPAGVPIGLVVGSYNNEITLTVTAEEYAVPDADKFLGWVQEEYELLKRRSS